MRLALDGKIAQRDLTLDEARQFDAAVTVRIEDAVARADFASAPLPDFAAASSDPHRVVGVLADHASRAQIGTEARSRLREALARLEEVLTTDQQPAEAGR